MEKEFDKLLDKVQFNLFLNSTKNSSFYSTVGCSTKIEIESRENFIAKTDGIKITFNPTVLSGKSKEELSYIYLHEVLHIALLHHPRMGRRDTELWNIACDIKINGILDDDGYEMRSIKIIRDNDLKHLTEEEIYNVLDQNGSKEDTLKKYQGSNGSDNELGNDLADASGNSSNFSEQIGNVYQAAQLVSKSGSPSPLLESITGMINEFLKPKVIWENKLQSFLTELSDNEDYSWAKRNRRYTDIYLPGMVQEEDGLPHIVFYIDTSGSVSDEELQQYLSEIKYIHETFKPQLLSIVCFDTRIHRRYTFESHDHIENFTIEGRGGTCLRCVLSDIESLDPTAVVVFSDLYCDPMDEPSTKTPILWFVSGRYDKNVDIKSGEIVHIE